MEKTVFHNQVLKGGVHQFSRVMVIRLVERVSNKQVSGLCGSYLTLSNDENARLRGPKLSKRAPKNILVLFDAPFFMLKIDEHPPFSHSVITGRFFT